MSGIERLEARWVPAAILPDGFLDAPVVSAGLDEPQSMTVAPDGRIFVAERDGGIRVIKDGALLAEPFATIDDVTTEGAQGLMGLAFDPNFAQNPYVYAYYVSTEGGTHNRLVRMQAEGDRAVPGSEVVLFDSPAFRLEPGVPFHNGGSIAFGADGMLYIPTGDMGHAEDAQSLNSIAGKILRIAPDGTIPTDNPFYRQATGLNRAIWALGLRNPFTLDVHDGTGRMHVNDVGSVAWEEVNLAAPGANFGWPRAEGPTTDRLLTSPAYAYSYTDPEVPAGCVAITGGAFYDPAVANFPPEYHDDYFFVNYCGGWIRQFDPATGEVSTLAQGLPDLIIDLDVAPDGTMYYLLQNGEIRQIRYDPMASPQLVQPVVDQVVHPGETATFRVDVYGSGPFAYQWKRNGVKIPGAVGPTYQTPPTSLSDQGVQFSVSVSNPYGTVESNVAYLGITTNSPPVIRMLLPRVGRAVRAGQPVVFFANANDPETGRLPHAAFQWRVDTLHNTHSHPATFQVSGRRWGWFRAPEHGDPARDDIGFRVVLTVTDPDGQVSTATRDVDLVEAPPRPRPWLPRGPLGRRGAFGR